MRAPRRRGYHHRYARPQPETQFPTARVGASVCDSLASLSPSGMDFTTVAAIAGVVVVAAIVLCLCCKQRAASSQPTVEGSAQLLEVRVDATPAGTLVVHIPRTDHCHCYGTIAKGSTSWLKAWAKAKGREPYTCFIVGCNRTANAGAHVKWHNQAWIVPTCGACNTSGNGRAMWIPSSSDLAGPLMCKHLPEWYGVLGRSTVEDFTIVMPK